MTGEVQALATLATLAAWCTGEEHAATLAEILEPFAMTPASRAIAVYGDRPMADAARVLVQEIEAAE